MQVTTSLRGYPHLPRLVRQHQVSRIGQDIRNNFPTLSALLQKSPRLPTSCTTAKLFKDTFRQTEEDVKVVTFPCLGQHMYAMKQMIVWERSLYILQE